MGEPADPDQGDQPAKESNVLDLSAQPGDSLIDAESSLLSLADQIDEQLIKCREISEWVLAKLDEVEAQYPPLPDGMRTMKNIFDELGIFNSNGELEAAKPQSNFGALEKDMAAQNPLARLGGDRNASPAFNHGALRFFAKKHPAPLTGDEKTDAINSWLDLSRAIDEREGLPEILRQEQAQWDKLDELIQAALKIPAVSLSALQAKVRIITASNSAQSEISFGDTIDDVLTNDLMQHLTRTKPLQND